MKENFYSLVNGIPTLRNLKEESHKVENGVMESYLKGEVDEAIMIYDEIYDNKTDDYKDNCMYQRFGCFLKGGDRVLDLGANIGIFTNFAADKGASKIYSIEPVLQNFHMLMRNLPIQAEAHRLAVSNEDNKSVKINYTPKCPGGSICDFVKEDNNENNYQNVMTITLDTLIDNGIIEQPDFIKMDIEGAEHNAFAGISDRNLEKVRCIAMEIHRNVIGEENTKTIYDRLSGLGFQHFTVWGPTKLDFVWFWKE